MSFGNFKFGATPAASTSTAPAAGASQPFSFGSQPAQAAPAAGTGLFGSTAQPAAQTGGLFGSTAQPATSTGGGLFGSTSQPQPQQQQQQGQQSGSLFGGGSLFGAKPTGTAAPAATGSLFGNQQNQQSQPQQTSLFGQNQPQAQAQTSLFGQSTNQNIGQSQQNQGGLFNQSQQNNSLQKSSAGPSSGINKTTKFADLPEQVQKTIEQMDGWIKQQKAAGSDMNVEDLGRAIWQTSSDVKTVTEEYSALSQGLTSLQNSLNQLRARFLTEEEDLRKIAEIWETFKSVDGRPGAVRVAAHRDFPQDFFSRAAQGMEERVQRYKSTIAQLNRVVISLSREHESPSPQAIAQTIQNHQNAIFTLAAQLENLQLRMGDLKQRFSEEYRERTNSMRDPFEVARQEKGLPVK